MAAVPVHDVAVVGVHLSSGLLAAALARRGVDVVLVPSAADEPTPAGESTVPYTAELFALFAARFDLPEVADLGSFGTVPAALRRTSGRKGNLGFLYHRPGRGHSPAEALQFTVPSEHGEWHPYRPDVDAWAAGLAVDAGAGLAAAEVSTVDVDRDGVTVHTAGGPVRARYVVDASGLGLVGSPGTGPVRHRTRLLATHLLGVRPFDEVVGKAGYDKHAGRWHDGTLLHAFPGGWVQLTPFGNHPDSVNPLVGVTVSLDPEQHPDRGEPPAEEVTRVLAAYPQLAAQLAGAAETRPWTVSEDWVRLPGRSAGPRWLSFDRGAGRHDLLLSREVTAGLELAHGAAVALLAMARDGDWAGPGAERFARFQSDLLAYHDRVVAAARTATADFALWNGFLRAWLLWSILSALALKRERLDAAASGRWDALEHFDDGAFWFRAPDGLARVMEDVLGTVEATRRGLPPALAARQVFTRLRKEPIAPPLYDFGDPDARYYRFTLGRRLRMLVWAKTVAPASFRRLLTPGNVSGQAESLRTPA
jgi:tetracycline 7-halogenase / FADH2 O2-dependent halogenase